jgi:polyphosphate kinase 2 (PPK2 family)
MKKTKATIHTVQIPSVTQEFARALDSNFPAIEIKPGTPNDDIKYNAGVRLVVEFVKRHAVGKSGTINRITNAPNPVGR